MKHSSLWVIEPRALATITRALNAGPSIASCRAAQATLGLSPDELKAALQDECAGGTQPMADELLARSVGQDNVLPSGAGVAVIPLKGVLRPNPSIISMLFGMGGGGLRMFREQLRQAVASDDVTSILLDVDSPGGTIDLIPETAADIREAAKVKTVRAIANTDAASAAYWLASQADELAVTSSGRVGSIGVFMVHDDWSGFNERMGVTPTYIAAGKFKTEANPDAPLSDEAREAMQAEVDSYYDMFVADVAKGRGTTAAKVRAGFGEGRMVTAKDAIAEGMADTVETFESLKTRVTGGTSRRSRADESLSERPQAKVNERARALRLARPRHR